MLVKTFIGNCVYPSTFNYYYYFFHKNWVTFFTKFFKIFFTQKIKKALVLKTFSKNTVKLRKPYKIGQQKLKKANNFFYQFKNLLKNSTWEFLENPFLKTNSFISNKSSNPSLNSTKQIKLNPRYSKSLLKTKTNLFFKKFFKHGKHKNLIIQKINPAPQTLQFRLLRANTSRTFLNLYFPTFNFKIEQGENGIFPQLLSLRPSYQSQWKKTSQLKYLSYNENITPNPSIYVWKQYLKTFSLLPIRRKNFSLKWFKWKIFSNYQQQKKHNPTYYLKYKKHDSLIFFRSLYFKTKLFSSFSSFSLKYLFKNNKQNKFGGVRAKNPFKIKLSSGSISTTKKFFTFTYQKLITSRPDKFLIYNFYSVPTKNSLEKTTPKILTTNNYLQKSFIKFSNFVQNQSSITTRRQHLKDNNRNNFFLQKSFYKHFKILSFSKKLTKSIYFFMFNQLSSTLTNVFQKCFIKITLPRLNLQNHKTTIKKKFLIAKARLLPLFSESFLRNLFFFVSLQFSLPYKTNISLDKKISSIRSHYNFINVNQLKRHILKKTSRDVFYLKNFQKHFSLNSPNKINERSFLNNYIGFFSYAQTKFKNLLQNRTELSYSILPQESISKKLSRMHRVRFKPGYARQWRFFRTDVKHFFKIKFRYQHKLTVFLQHHYYYKRKLKQWEIQTRIISFLVQIRFFPDEQTAYEIFNTKNVYLNGFLCTNSQTTVFYNDFLQLLINLKYYIVLKWLITWVTKTFSYISKIRKITREKKNLNLSNKLLFFKYSNYDVPRYVEVDFFTLSAFVIKTDKNIDFLTYDFNSTLKSNIFNVYNWKYIT